MFKAQRLTPLSLSLVRTILESASQERKDVLGAVSLVTGRVIDLLDRVKEAVMVGLSLQVQQQQQVA